MIRYGTGDLSAILAGESPCGRTNLRIKGWMGRADQSAKLKGMFVHAKLVDDVIRWWTLRIAHTEVDDIFPPGTSLRLQLVDDVEHIGR